VIHIDLTKNFNYKTKKEVDRSQNKQQSGTRFPKQITLLKNKIFYQQMLY